MPNPKCIDWDAQPLGVIRDAELARQLGVTHSAVGYARRRRRIPAVKFVAKYDQSKCSGCQMMLPAADFNTDRHTPNGLARYCRSCQKPKRAMQYQQNKGTHRAAARRRKFGMDAAEYDRRLQAQHGVCAICKAPPEDGEVLCVDHEHNTGLVRGLLCTRCNLGLGQFRDNPAVLAAAIRYLEDE